MRRWLTAPITWIGIIIATIILMIIIQTILANRQCAELLSYAQTRRDTLNAKIACTILQSGHR